MPMASRPRLGGSLPGSAKHRRRKDRREGHSMVMSPQKITPFFTLTGQAEEAMMFYMMSLFEHAELLSIQRYGPH
jgi:hypothetical protein